MIIMLKITYEPDKKSEHSLNEFSIWHFFSNSEDFLESIHWFIDHIRHKRAGSFNRFNEDIFTDSDKIVKRLKDIKGRVIGLLNLVNDSYIPKK
jgi:hypothetical protein